MAVKSTSSLSTTDSGEIPQSQLPRMAGTLEAIRAELPAMRPLAEEAAARLADGGGLWACGIRSLVGEFTGRAGGFMMIRMIKPAKDKLPAGQDVVLGFPEDGPRLHMPELADGPLTINFADYPSSPDNLCLATHARERRVSPTLAMAACGWVFTGELVASLTRMGKMPVIYETIGAYHGHLRIKQYNRGEIAWHESHEAPEIAPGVLGGRYIDTVTAMLGRIEKEEGEKLDRAKEWAHEARADGKRLFMYSMGHIFPDEISKNAIGEQFESAVWNAGFPHAKPDDEYSAGDFVAHIGYQHPPGQLLRKARAAGARVVYVCLRHDRDFERDPNVIRIDPMWDWSDACVPLEGYDVPLLPASGVINGAIAWELAG
ncbi:MAG: hypothetical protein Q7T82_06490 [Armatimonadota bacterium]|nr:hypothetical protein [Armatimonadota bacterium]